MRVLRKASVALITDFAATFSLREAPSEELLEVLTGLGLVVEVKGGARFNWGVRDWVRHLGEQSLPTVAGGPIDVSVHAGPTFYPGRLALLPYVHEQAASVTNHRFGYPMLLTDGLCIWRPASTRRQTDLRGLPVNSGRPLSRERPGGAGTVTDDTPGANS